MASKNTVATGGVIKLTGAVPAFKQVPGKQNARQNWYTSLTIWQGCSYAAWLAFVTSPGNAPSYQPRGKYGNQMFAEPPQGWVAHFKGTAAAPGCLQIVQGVPKAPPAQPQIPATLPRYVPVGQVVAAFVGALGTPNVS